MPAGRAGWLALAVLLEAALVAVVHAAQAPLFPLLPCLIWISVAGLVYLIAVAAVVRAPAAERPRVRWIFLAALVFRLTLLPVPPHLLSQQAARVRWEGKIQQAGFNPYAYAPNNDLLQPIRTPQDGPLAEPGVAAFHPPLAELLFHWDYAWLPGPRTQKLLWVLFDLLLIVLLVRVLRARGQPPQWALIYAWSPLAVFEVAGNGHFEPVAGLLALLGLHWAGRRVPQSAIAAMSAALTQWYAWLLLPFILVGRRWRAALGWMVAWSALLTLPYLFINRQLVFRQAAANLRAHAAAAAVPFNASLFGLTHAWFGAHTAAAVSAALVLAVLVACLARRVEPLRAAFLVIAALLLALPQVHAWTVLWLLPLVAVFPEAPWLYFSLAVLWSYQVAGHPAWVAIEYAPLYLLLAWQAFRPGRREQARAA